MDWIYSSFHHHGIAELPATMSKHNLFSHGGSEDWLPLFEMCNLPDPCSDGQASEHINNRMLCQRPWMGSFEFIVIVKLFSQQWSFHVVHALPFLLSKLQIFFNEFGA